MDIKHLISRLPVILLGYCAASLTAGAILVTAYLLWLTKAMDLHMAAVSLTLIGFLIYSSWLLLPVLVVAAIAEWLCIQRLAAYLLFGALCLVIFALYLGAIRPRLATSIGEVMFVVIIASAGIVAGLVYWSIAGRNAGAGRRSSQLQ